MSPVAWTNAKLTALCNSRTFPGHGYACNSSNTSAGTERIDLPSSRLNRCRKCSTSNGRSARRLAQRRQVDGVDFQAVVQVLAEGSLID